MTQAAVTADVHQTLDVHLRALAQVAFDLALSLDDRADAPQLLLVEVAHARVPRDARLFENRVRARAPDTINVRQSDLDALIDRQIDANHTSHSISPFWILDFGLEEQMSFLIQNPKSKIQNPFSLAAVCVSGLRRSRAPRLCGG